MLRQLRNLCLCTQTNKLKRRSSQDKREHVLSPAAPQKVMETRTQEVVETRSDLNVSEKPVPTQQNTVPHSKILRTNRPVVAFMA